MWQDLADKAVEITAGYRESTRLGRFLGSGGAGAVYELPNIGSGQWVIKILDTENSAVARQELRSLDIFRSRSRFLQGLMKFNRWSGKLRFCDDPEKVYHCYFMRGGRSLQNAIDEKAPLLADHNELLRLMAFLISGLHSMKELGFGHGDIKPENVLLTEFDGTIYPMLADYGTVAEKRLDFVSRNFHYTPRKSEYRSELEELIACDLHSLYLTLCRAVECDGNVLPARLGGSGISRALRVMRNSSQRAFERLDILYFGLRDNVFIPPAFYLSGVASYECDGELPLEKIMPWQNGHIVRALPSDRTASGEFDPLFCQFIPDGVYEKVCRIILTADCWEFALMPICRYHCQTGEFVVIHAPDDFAKCGGNAENGQCRLTDPSGEPYTLAKIRDPELRRQLIKELDPLRRAARRCGINIDFAARNIWMIDGKIKVNLFACLAEC